MMNTKWEDIPRDLRFTFLSSNIAMFEEILRNKPTSDELLKRIEKKWNQTRIQYDKLIEEISNLN